MQILNTAHCTIIGQDDKGIILYYHKPLIKPPLNLALKSEATGKVLVMSYETKIHKVIGETLDIGFGPVFKYMYINPRLSIVLYIQCA